MQTGQSKFGMQTMNQSIYDLFIRGLITKDEAIGRSSVPEELMAMINRGGIGAGGMK
jgi:twitching motility protein PilT